MATYQELYDIAVNDGPTMYKVVAACAVQADVIRQESGGTANHANRLIWAKQAFSDPKGTATKMMWALMAANVAATAAQIRSASDASVLQSVANAVDIFATGS